MQAHARRWRLLPLYRAVRRARVCRRCARSADPVLKDQARKGAGRYYYEIAVKRHGFAGAPLSGAAFASPSSESDDDTSSDDTSDDSACVGALVAVAAAGAACAGACAGVAAGAAGAACTGAARSGSESDDDMSDEDIGWPRSPRMGWGGGRWAGPALGELPLRGSAQLLV